MHEAPFSRPFGQPYLAPFGKGEAHEKTPRRKISTIDLTGVYGVDQEAERVLERVRKGRKYKRLEREQGTPHLLFRCFNGANIDSLLETGQENTGQHLYFCCTEQQLATDDETALRSDFDPNTGEDYETVALAVYDATKMLLTIPVYGYELRPGVKFQDALVGVYTLQFPEPSE